MNIQNILRALVMHYGHSRGAGHTRLMLEGVKNCPEAAVIGGDCASTWRLRDAIGDKRIWINLANIDRMAGLNAPLAIDNHALNQIFSAALREIAVLDSRVMELQKNEAHILSVCINGIDKAELLAALYNAAKPQGAGFLSYDPTEMTVDQARQIVEHRTRFDYLVGRVLKIDLSHDSLHIALYERDNGVGVATRIVAELHAQADADADAASEGA